MKRSKAPRPVAMPLLGGVTILLPADERPLARSFHGAFGEAAQMVRARFRVMGCVEVERDE